MFYGSDIRERYAFLVECVRYSNTRRGFCLIALAAEGGAQG